VLSVQSAAPGIGQTGAELFLSKMENGLLDFLGVAIVIRVTRSRAAMRQSRLFHFKAIHRVELVNQAQFQQRAISARHRKSSRLRRDEL